MIESEIKIVRDSLIRARIAQDARVLEEDQRHHQARIDSLKIFVESIKEARRAGMSIPDISQIIGISKPRIYQIFNQTEES